MDKIIYTDVDLTLLDFNDPFEKFVRSRGYDIPEGATKGQAHLPNCFDVSVEEATHLVKDFFLDDAFGKLSEIAGSRDVVRRLYDRGWDFVAITACPDSVHEKRIDNLRNVFGIEFLDVVYSGFGGCKRDILERYAPTIWVEDNLGHAQIGHDLGYRTFLINHEHNLGAETAAIRVDHWSEIEDALCRMAS